MKLDSSHNRNAIKTSAVADELLNCHFSDYSTKHAFRILNQNVRISNFDWKNESFSVNTEIQLIPMKSDAKTIQISLGRSSYLPNDALGPKDVSVTVQGYPAKADRDDVQMRNTLRSDRKNLHNLKSSIKRAYEKASGSFTILIPRECAEDVKAHRVLTVQISTNVVKPKFGVKFDFKTDSAGRLVPGGHAFTYRSSVLSSTHEWIPCLDDADQLALWSLDFEVPSNFNVISCGDLLRINLYEKRGVKTFSYQLKTPTSAANIGFVIGDVDSLVLPELPDITSYTLPGLKANLENTISSLPAIITFLEETLAGRFPYSSYKLVFIDNVPEEVISFASMSIFSINLLYHKKILDVVQTTRQIMALGVATQFFGCLVNASDFTDFWLVKAMARYITGLYIEQTFGLSEYIYQINSLIEMICNYEDTFGPVVLRHKDPKSHADLHFDPTCAHTCSPNYADMLYKKGQVVLRVLETRVGREPFLKVLQRVVLIALEYGRHHERPVDWYHAVISVDSFFDTVTNVTGRELPSFLDVYVNSGGHALFEVHYSPNRKRNTIELEVRQDIRGRKGAALYLGPLTIAIQELDGYFTHTIQIDSDVSKHDIPCHSKGRKQKRKKVIISTGEELEIDLASMDVESPIMWLRLDPQMQLIRRVTINQPDYQWEYMLRHERCVVAQLDAIEYLYNRHLQGTHSALYDAVQNERFFHKVRSKAAICLTEVCNRLPSGLVTDSTPIITYFKDQYGCKSDTDIPVLNNFVATSSNLQSYFLMTSLPSAIARTRRDGRCTEEVVKFLLGLLKYNDNSVNRYSDDFYRASLITALAVSLSGVDRCDPNRPELMDPIIKEVIFEVTRALNKDLVNPSYSRVVAQACLKAIFVLQRNNYLPLDPEIFWRFAETPDVFCQLRLAAYSCLTNMVHCTHNNALTEVVMRLFDTVLNDPNPHIRYSVGMQLIAKPPFLYTKDIPECLAFSSNTEQLAEKLWLLVNDIKLEPRLRAILTDIFYVMYSTETPFMLFPEEDRRQMEHDQRKKREIDNGVHRL